MWRKKQFIKHCEPQTILVRNEENVMIDVSDPKEIAKIPPLEVYTIDNLLAGKIPLDVIPLNLSSPEQDQLSISEVTKFISDVESQDHSKSE